MAEFELIERYFGAIARSRDDVAMGIGDDCALLNVPADRRLAVSTDTLVAGVHFPQMTSADDIGYKALAVNLSDLAAVGAEPAWATLCLTLPEENERWLTGFSRGFSELLNRYGVQLVGGDTTRGALSMTVTVFGFVKPGDALYRHAARVGDQVYVTGTLGDAGLGLKKILATTNGTTSLHHCVSRLNRPMPRIDIGMALHGKSRCAIDISDGLLADLGHISKRSDCGVRIHADRVPLSSELKEYYKQVIDWKQILTAGDDYELCFTAGIDKQEELQALSSQFNTPITCIGEITEGQGVHCVLPDGSLLDAGGSGYTHF